MRKIVQICATPDTDTSSDILYALCDDGSVWALYDPISDDAKWAELKRLPREEPVVIVPPDNIEFKPTGEFLVPHEQEEDGFESVKLGPGLRWADE